MSIVDHMEGMHAAQVAKLERLLKEAVEERDHYRDKTHELAERLSAMTSAASSAASSTVTALERIQRMEVVLNAAIAWRNGGTHANLTDAVNDWLDYKKTWA